MMQRPYVLSIAGHDPCGGAGLNADIKTFEHFKTNGFTACTALTVQNEDDFLAVEWTSLDCVLAQLDVLLKRYDVYYVKIGLVPSFDVLTEILSFVHKKNTDIKIIWDPILRATSGFTFHNTFDKLHELLNHIYLLTPNRNEIMQLTGLTDPLESAKMLSRHCNILLKGGHAKEHATDMLIENGEKAFEVPGDRFKSSDKHGTGCVLSSAITANLALGKALEEACQVGKHYVESFLQSNDTRLGFHS